MVFCFFFFSCIRGGGNPSIPVSSGNIGDNSDIGIIKYKGVYLNLKLPSERWWNGDQEYWRRGFPSNIPAWSFGDKKKKSIITCLYFEDGRTGDKENFLALVRAELRAFNKNMPRKFLPVSVEDFVNSYGVDDLKEIDIDGVDGVSEVFLETQIDYVDKAFCSQVTFFTYKNFFFMVHNQTGFVGGGGHRYEIVEKIIPRMIYRIFPYVS